MQRAHGRSHRGNRGDFRRTGTTQAWAPSCRSEPGSVEGTTFMQDIANQLMRSSNAHATVTKIYQRRAQHATEAYASRVEKLWREQLTAATGRPVWPWELAASWQEYAIDFCQRSILF